MPALFDFKGYDNEVVAKRIDSILLTKMDMNQFMTPDYSLTENEGMVKKIRTYLPTEAVEDLERGEGLSSYVDAEFTEREYRVKRTQSGARWYDDDFMTDEMWVQTKIDGVAESMVNDWTRKALKEFGKTTNQVEFTNWDYSDFVDAMTHFDQEFESEDGLFFLCSADAPAKIRKMLNDNLKYVEGYVRTGYIGSVNGVPIYWSKAVPSGMMFLATRDAVHAFLKKQTFVEQDRDIDTKMNRMIAAKYAVIALFDERKVIACGAKNAQDTTITTKAAGAAVVAGAAPTGASVTVFVNGKQFGLPVVAAGNAYSVTGLDDLVAGDHIRVVAELEGFLNGVATAIAE